MAATNYHSRRPGQITHTNRRTGMRLLSVSAGWCSPAAQVTEVNTHVLFYPTSFVVVRTFEG